MSRPADPHAKIDLLRAAESVFVEHGLDHARVEDITGRAGRSKGAFYLHFEGKEDAFRQIVETMIARMAQCLDDAPQLVDGVGVEAGPQLLAAWRDKDVEIFEFIWQNRGVMRLLLEGGKSAAFGYLIDEFAERSRVHTMRTLAWGVREGIFRADLDVELASLVLSGAYDRVARDMVRRNRKPDLQTMFAQMQRTLMYGLASPAIREITDPMVKNPRTRRSR
jgi:AcrR family transcriptional regulator